MDIRLLGPLEVVSDGRPCTLPARAEQSLLVRLALDAGHVVPAGSLIDALWGDNLPADPGNALQLRVSKLRRALAAQGLPAGLITTRAPGYLAQVDPDQVDAVRFTSLVAEARRLAGQAPDDALRRYQQALDLWRGPALTGFVDEGWAQPEAARLEEARLSAIEERAELLLAAGRYTEVAGDLETLVQQHPLRERLHGQLMLALYHSGRQAEALAAYQRARRILDSELGLEPSPELRRLQEDILRQDPRLGGAAGPRPAAHTGLPTRLTSFVGRTAETEQLLGLLARQRLVTLTGPGGVGKTSLAIEAARRGSTGDGACLVKLAPVGEPALLARAVADALGVPAAAEADEDRLIACLRGRQVLLLLDNCEHLAAPCAVLAERLLACCPDLRILATSREPLGVAGETQYALTPLSVPPRSAEPADLTAYDAVRLFLDRARSALPEFALDGDSSPAVARICRSLDGIPLAVELAAARIKTLPVQEISSRLDDRFALLTATTRTAEARQQTLRATIDWSYRLLTEPEQILFRRLSVFRGGCGLDAAETLCADGDLERGDILDLLGHLVDRSMVVAGHAGRARFRLLETLREYGARRLREAGEEERFADAHARYFTGLAERGEPELRGSRQGQWLGWLKQERDNIRAALTWCHAHAGSDPDRGLRLVAALGWFWYFASHIGGGREVERMLAAAEGGSPSARGRALQAQSLAGRPGACVVHPDQRCAAAARASLRLFEETGDTHRAAYSRTLLAVEGITGNGTRECLAMLPQAVEEFARRGDEWGRALTLFVEMELRFTLGTFDTATEYAERALSVFTRLGDHWGTSAIQYHLGLALHRAGRPHAALDAYAGALAEGRKTGMANTVQYALANAGLIKLAFADLPGAEQCFEQSHAVARELGADGNPLAAMGQAHLARQREDLDVAQAHYTRVLELLEGQDKPDWTAAALTGLGFVAELSGRLDTAESCHLRAWHVAAPAGCAAAVAGAMEGLACATAACGDGTRAANLLGAAARWREEHRCPASSLEWQDIERGTDRARALIGDDHYRAAYAAGLAEDPARPPAMPSRAGFRTRDAGPDRPG
ncbi:BTAD domain-containing putative transcriptional regulator [Streptomyces sp. NPDC020490]|uniref:BTAD domain-containing putative transcriptional regulator n=1 Tax=Streptomyces sp. NPDC020490 TaxID=3365078 RepID=UPI0037963AD1